MDQNLVQSLLLAIIVMAMEKLDLIKVFLQFNKLVQSVVVMENVLITHVTNVEVMVKHKAKKTYL